MHPYLSGRWEDLWSLMRWKMYKIPCFPLYVLQETITVSQDQDLDVIRNKVWAFNIIQHLTIILLMFWFLFKMFDFLMFSQNTEIEQNNLLIY